MSAFSFTHKKVYLLNYSNNKGKTTTSSFTAIQWIDLGYDVTAHVEDLDGNIFDTEPLNNVVLSADGRVASSKKGTRYILLRKNDKTRNIKKPSFVDDSNHSEMIKDPKEASKWINNGHKVKAVFNEPGNVKVTTAYIKTIDIDAKSFVTVTGLTYLF